ncbi:uncharacterized protein PITG_02798 [Phytophthora infestans T30-4]|uniref:Uncharacterized protein n=2 Tax=Phytophthora infestans TaxID=4787 RepID=D0MX91_PHYIT|nr:uncharacterized protein PITG_02798 [Phytophthora infestans T30-4]EEY64254.1 conserved hypothetical protein [Phytophthora infestans T30-4]|eukprot:XP_002907690.1 conserved hypothetical protein [Phytophthora infestans T30-4]
MLAGVNDSIETAHTLGKLLQNRSVHVNLIPYNTTDVGAQFQSPSAEDIRAFHAVLREPYNLKATIRENHGTDIDGACGQLALKNKPDGSRDIEDLGPRRTKAPRKTKKSSSTSDNASVDASPVATSTGSWLTRVNVFIDEYQQAIGFILLGASVAVLAIGIARRGRTHLS